LISNQLKDSETALVNLTDIVKGATSTMTSVPKPFKFLRVHYKAICEYYNTLQSSEHKVFIYIFRNILPTFYQFYQWLLLKEIQELV
jgi:26S proteasome regulatory subunit N1